MKILIVEDEKDIRDLLEKGLRHEGFSVDTAEDGIKGSNFARTNEYDLIVLDNMLPGKTGLQVCQDIRGTGSSVPIIMLSALSETKQKIDLLNAGADDYLSKPFSFSELVARIRALLRRPSGVQGEMHTIADLVLDTKKAYVKRADKEINLTPKEFSLLEYLMQNAGSVLTRGMIMEHAWDMNIDPFSRTIESHIASLRKKITPKGSAPLIHTVQGRGYKIDTE